MTVLIILTSTGLFSMIFIAPEGQLEIFMEES